MSLFWSFKGQKDSHEVQNDITPTIIDSAQVLTRWRFSRCAGRSKKLVIFLWQVSLLFRSTVLLLYHTSNLMLRNDRIWRNLCKVGHTTSIKILKKCLDRSCQHPTECLFKWNTKLCSCRNIWAEISLRCLFSHFIVKLENIFGLEFFQFPKSKNQANILLQTQTKQTNKHDLLITENTCK